MFPFFGALLSTTSQPGWGDLSPATTYTLVDTDELANNGGTSVLGLRLLTTGAAAGYDAANFATAETQWFTPVDDPPGSAYEVQIVRTSGVTPTCNRGAIGVGNWYNLGTMTEFEIASSVVGTIVSGGTVTIREVANPSNSVEHNYSFSLTSITGG